MEKVSLDISREEELSETVGTFPILYDKPHKGLTKRCCEKCMAWSHNGV